MSQDTEGREPLPIWFFVGVILAVYGVLVIAGNFMTSRPTVLSETRPGLWWGALMVVAGGIFTAIGVVAHRKG
jgi:drug/metabolite transporter (DMT)-like permease